MSIINKVLQEIEKNRGDKSADTPNVKLELGSSFDQTKRKIFTPLTVMGAIVVILAIILFFIYHNATPKTPSQTKTPAQENIPAKTGATIAPVKEANVKLTGVTVNADNNKTIVNFDLSLATYYYVEHSKDQLQLKLTLSNTTYDREFNLKFDHTAIKNITFQKINNNVEINIALLPDTQIIGLQLYNQPQNQLKLTLLNTGIPVGTVSKKAVPLTNEEKANQDYEAALDLLDEGKVDLAINKLRNAVKNSADPECYELLATLLIKGNSYDEADKILASALVKFPTYPNYYQLKAYILMQHGNSARALEVLLENPPEIAQNPDYYALIANVYQQQNQYLLAAKIYNQLVHIRPERAMWWFGLGVALESSGKKNAAQEAYRRAQALGDLPANINNFIDAQMR